MPAPRTAPLALAALATLALLILSGWNPHDRATWLMEVAPVLVVLPLLCLTYEKFPLTPLLYVCIVAHAVVLMVGGAYTHARVPIGFAVQDTFHLSRNAYDKLGHFVQGFVPALAAREILIRGGYVNGRRMRAFLVVCVVLAISAAYEVVEWGAAPALGQGADEFLGTQGDPWDTQSDRFTALIGSLVALTCFARIHDHQLERFTPDGRRG